MPESGDPFARLLRGVDGPAAPRPEFADALLDRLLGELTSNMEAGPAGAETGIAPSSSGPRALPSVTPSTDRGGNGGPLSPIVRKWGRFQNPLTALATAALVLLTLLASFVAFRTSHLARTDDLLPIAAVIDSLATPDPLAPSGVTAVTLVETTLPAEALPHGVTGCALDLSDIPPESDTTWNVFQNVNLRYVLSGEITVRSNSAAQVLRARSDGTWETVSAGTSVTLAPGDAILFLNMTTATFSNTGSAPVETLGWQLVLGGSGGPNPTPPQWRGMNAVLCPTGGIPLPGTAGVLRLRQVELAPDATLPPLPAAIIQMSLASPTNGVGTPVSAFGSGTRSDGTIYNHDQKTAPFYVVTLEPLAADNKTPQSGSPGA